MPTATKEKTEIIVSPFGVEVDTPKNNDVLIQSIPGCRLRGGVRARANVRMMPMVPEIPGMQLHVNPAKLAYRIIDPLHGNEDLCEQIRVAIKNSSGSGIGMGDVLRGVAPQEGELDIDRMKTLCREMAFLVKSNMAKMVKGALPSEKDLEELPGDFLLNPGSMVPNGQPRYEKDMPAFQRRLNTGGA